MAAITGTLAKRTEMGGEWKLLVLTATVGSASDTITLTAAAHGVSEIAGIVGLVITGGQDAAFTGASASFSGLVITVTSVEQDGTPSTDWTGTTISITVLAR